MIRALAGLALFGMVASPTMAQGIGLADLDGAIYSGAATVEAMQQPDGTASHQARGTAEITFSQKDGHLLMEGHATIDGQHAMRFDYELAAQQDGSWRHDEDGETLTISPKGEIVMQAQTDAIVISASGQIDAAALQLNLHTTGHAVEPDFAFFFDLVRQDKARPDQTGKCDDVVWQPRVVANPFGDTMSSVMVPVCVPPSRE